MPGAWRNENSVAECHILDSSIDFHNAAAFQNEIKLLAEFVVVAFGCATRGDGGFGEALVFDGGVGAVEDAADLGAVLGGEGFLTG